MNLGGGLGVGEPSILRSIARHRLLIAAAVLISALIGLLLFSLRSVQYTAEAGVLLEDPNSTRLLGESVQRDEDRYVADQVSILKSPALLGPASQLNQAADPLIAVSIKELQRNTTIRTAEGSNYIVVRYQAGDPTTAMNVANSIVKAYRELVRADIQAETAATLKRLDATITEVLRTIAASPTVDPANRLLLQQLRTRRSQVEVDAQLAGDGVALYSAAGPGRRESASLPATLLLAVVLGGLVGTGVAYVLDVRELRLSRRIAPRTRLRAPVIAEIPDFSQEGLSSVLPVLDAPDSEPAETFRFLAAAIALRRGSLDGSVSSKLAESLQGEIPGMTDRELAVLDQVTSRLDKIAQESQKKATRRGKGKRDLMIRSVAFLSAVPGDGTTTLAANTALAAAQAGDRVLALDGDLWGRGLTQLLLDEASSSGRNGRRVGLTDMLLRGLLPEGIRLVSETPSGGSLSLIEPGATTLEAMNAIRTELIRPGLDATLEDYDRVFIDVPPILQFPYADALVTSADAVVVVFRRRGDIARLGQLLDHLDLLGVRPLGQVSNFVTAQQAVGRDLTSEMRSAFGALTSYLTPRRQKTSGAGSAHASHPSSQPDGTVEPAIEHELRQRL